MQLVPGQATEWQEVRKGRFNDHWHRDSSFKSCEFDMRLTVACSVSRLAPHMAHACL
jgi:hypothetical protein